MGNQIELIKKLYAKKKTYKVPKEPKEGIDQVSLEITQLSLEDLGGLDMREDMPLSDMAKSVISMVAKSLEITEEEAGKISFEFMGDLLDIVTDANGFNEEDMKKTGIKSFIEKKKELIKEKEEKECGKSNKQS